jgi:hypothetical protein
VFDLESYKDLLDGFMDASANLCEGNLALVFLVEFLFKIKVSDVGELNSF